MDFVKFLSSNWAQITVMLGALGYVVKIILDYSIRKKEIKFDYLDKQKAAAFEDFLLSTRQLSKLLSSESFGYLYGSVEYADFEEHVQTSRAELDSLIDILYMYCNESEIEDLYGILNASAQFPFAFKGASDSKVQELLTAYRSKTNVRMKKLVREFKM